jgi:hypothetical protein
MERASAYASRGYDLAKNNPKTLLALGFSLVMFILVCVNIFSLMGVKDDEVTGNSKTKVRDARRSGYGIGVMALIGCGIAYYNYKKSSE